MTEIRCALERALLVDEGELLETLGARLRAIDINPSLAGSYEPDLPYAQPEDFRETFQELGQRIVRRWSRELYQLSCGLSQDDADDRKKIADALGLGEVAVASALTGILTSGFGIAPAIATIVAVIVVKRVFCADAAGSLPTMEGATAGETVDGYRKSPSSEDYRSDC